MVSDSSHRFVDHADALLRKLEEAIRLTTPPIPVGDLKYMVERIGHMRESAAAGSIPPREERYRSLTRMIADQWPLGQPLGILISDLEDKYISL